jgi:hypothetical protein
MLPYELAASPFAFFVLLVSGWGNRQRQAAIDYLLEENRFLRAVHGTRDLASPTTSGAAWP